MMKLRWFIPPLSCLAIFHSPDGTEIRIETRHIVAVRPADAVKQHLASGTNALIYTSTQTFGVIETVSEVKMLEDECVAD